MSDLMREDGGEGTREALVLYFVVDVSRRMEKVREFAIVRRNSDFLRNIGQGWRSLI